MGNILCILFSKMPILYFHIFVQKQQISENIEEKMMNISPIVNSVKCTFFTTLCTFLTRFPSTAYHHHGSLIVILSLVVERSMRYSRLFSSSSRILPPVQYHREKHEIHHYFPQLLKVHLAPFNPFNLHHALIY